MHICSKCNTSYWNYAFARGTSMCKYCKIKSRQTPLKDEAKRLVDTMLKDETIQKNILLSSVEPDPVAYWISRGMSPGYIRSVFKDTRYKKQVKYSKNNNWV